LLFSVSVLFVSSVRAQEKAKGAPATPAAVDPADEYAITETALDCAEVSRLARRSLERLDYQVTSVVPTEPGAVGVLKGARSFAWGDQETVTVKISCQEGKVAVDARPDVPPCEQANRISRLAVEHLGYKVTEFSPAAIGKPGIVKGAQPGKPEVYITLFCEGRMVTMDTSSDSPLLKNRDFYNAITDFRRGFYAVYKGQQRVVAAAATPVASNQLQVLMRPLSKVDTKTMLGSEVATMLAVQVEITNLTKRSYQLDPDKIMLVSIAGERVRPLPEKEHAFPVHALTTQAVVPGAKVKGYLYYQLGTYTGARGVLTEEKSQEREGFEVPF
jgi:hypothetical protein